jgi:hypothetical protein
MQTQQSGVHPLIRTHMPGSVIVPVRPEDALVRLIQETWTEVLGLDAVGPEDDFFEIGGHSLIVAPAVARLNERLGMNLTMRAVFAAPTPVEMAELITERRQRDAGSAGAVTPFFPDWVVPLQREGAGRPVFVFPAGHNETAALTLEARIAAHVGRERPFWGFRREDPELERAGQDGIAMVAAEYVKQMQAIQGSGPFLLYANCAGGYFAWETARQLLASGDRVAGLLFFEVPLRSDFDSLMPGLTPANVSLPRDLSRHFRPQPLPVDLTHLVTAEWQRWRWWEPWQRVVRGSAETVVIPDHSTGIVDFRAKRDAMIAERIRTWIAQAEARAGGA